MTSAGKLPAMASENAQPTMARMSPGRVEAVAAAAIATNSSSTRATISRLAVSVEPNQNGKTTSIVTTKVASSSTFHRTAPFVANASGSQAAGTTLGPVM